MQKSGCRVFICSLLLPKLPNLALRFTSDFLLMEFAIDYFFCAGSGHVVSQFHQPELLQGWFEDVATTGMMYYDLRTKQEWERLPFLQHFGEKFPWATAARQVDPNLPSKLLQAWLKDSPKTLEDLKPQTLSLTISKPEAPT